MWRNRQCYSGAKLRPAINCTGGVRSGCGVIYRSLRALIDFRHHLRENLLDLLYRTLDRLTPDLICRASRVLLRFHFHIAPQHVFAVQKICAQGCRQDGVTRYLRDVKANRRPVPMPTYKFKLRSNGDCLARELMRCRETVTRHWCLEVYRDGEGPVCDILFASVDPTLDHLRSATRTLVESANATKRALEDEIYSAKLAMGDWPALVAGSRGKPYLITRNGEITVRSLDQV